MSRSKEDTYCVTVDLVSLDIAKTYDTTWRPHILHKLQNILFNGKLLNCINSFLTNRTFSLKVNGHISTQFYQESGVPQDQPCPLHSF